MTALEELVVDAREIDRELVATFLKPYLRIDGPTCGIIPMPAWGEVPNEARVLLYLVARKAMRALELPIASEGASPQEIERATGIPGGSVRPALKRLLKARLVERQLGTGYIVPNYAMVRARAYVRQWAPDVAA
jgi:DNA-binding transcriptional ArsR family regulator